MNRRYWILLGILFNLNAINGTAATMTSQQYSDLITQYQTALKNYSNLQGLDRLNNQATLDEAFANLESATIANLSSSMVGTALKASGIFNGKAGEVFDQQVSDFFTAQQANIDTLSQQAGSAVQNAQTTSASEISGLNTQLGQLQSSYNTDQTQIVTLQNQYNTDQTQVSTLQNKYN